MSNNHNRGGGRRWLSTAVIGLSLLIFVFLFSPVGAAVDLTPLADSSFLASTAQSQNGRLNYTIQHYYDGTWYTGIYLADLNYDGKPELLIGNRDTSELEIYRYDAQSNAMAFVDSIAFPYHVHDIKAADFDKDGDMDIAVGLRNYGLYYAANSGPAGMIGDWSVAEIDGEYSLQVLVQDFDGDGNLDLFHGVDYGPINTWYGDGAGEFVQGAPVEDAASAMRFPRAFDAVDLDGDERLDLIGVDGSFMRAFLNPGDRTSAWSSVGPATPSGNYPCCEKKWLLADVTPSAADLDGNGVADQVANLQMRPSGANKVVIFNGSASGDDLAWTETPLDSIDGVGWAAHAGIADLDRDGNMDIHVGGGERFTGLHVYFGDGRGDFTADVVNLDHGVGGVNSFAVGDLNRDGSPDIVTTPYTSSAAEKSGFEVLFGSVNQPPIVDEQLTLVSTDEFGNQGNGVSWGAEISPNGRYAAFVSAAYNLWDGDLDLAQYALLVKDLQSDEYVDRVIRSYEDWEPSHLSLSENGRYLAYEVYDWDDPGPAGIRLRDIQQQEWLYSTDAREFNPSISSDGNLVVFEATTPDLVSGDTNGKRDIFVYNHQSGAIDIVSTARDAQGGIIYGNDDSWSPVISGDGRYVAFVSAAYNLWNEFNLGEYALLVKDLHSDTYVDKVIRSYDDWEPKHLSLSESGRYLAYEVYAWDDPGPAGIRLRDIQEQELLYSTYAREFNPSISNDGNTVVFEADTPGLVNGDDNGKRDIFVYDHREGRVSIVSASRGINGDLVFANGDSYNASVSAGGRYITFESRASNLVAGDVNDKRDIFLFDQGLHNGPLGDPEGLISAGEYHSCALRPDGSAACWGAEPAEDDHGQAADQAGPYIQVGAGAIHSCGLRPDGRVDCWGTEEWYGQGADHPGPFSQLAVGGNHNCGLRQDGSVDCWGGNWDGQAESKDGPFVQIGAGWDHTCGLQPDGAIDCWGSNAQGQSDGAEGPFVQVSVGWGHTCGLKLNGSVQCWGRNSDGQAQNQAGPFVQITAGGRHTCGLKSTGAVDCWGFNNKGQADGRSGPYVQISAGGTWMSGPDRWGHTCGLKIDGSVDCWGSNRDGQSTAPSGQFGPYSPQTAAVIAAGGNFTCGLKSDGKVICWGDNVARQVTVPVDLTEPFIAIDAGPEHACGLTAHGRAICWGENSLGQATGKDGPFTQLSTGADYNCGLKYDGSVDCWAGDNDWGETSDQAGPFIQVTSGANHNCALRPDGAVFCWGKDKQGQAGQPPGLFKQLSAGGNHSCGLTSNGHVECWGSNDYGQAADRTGLYGQVSAGTYHSCALKLDGSAECWGRNNYGQAENHAGPFVEISAGLSHTCAWRKDGSVQCWGDNQHGQAAYQPGPFGHYKLPVFLPVTIRN